MPTNKKSFIPFRLLLPSHPEYTECAAYTKDGNRCSSKLYDIIGINELHAALHNSYKTTIEDETREDMLKKLAELTICRRQKSRSKGIIEAAVHQWSVELQRQDSAAVSLETPPRNVNAQSHDDKGSPKWEFTPYKTAEIDKLVRGELTQELNRLIDGKISQNFMTHNWKNERDYMYIFECEEAEGMCKLGRTDNLPRRASQHEKCYPNLTQRWCLYCPNSKVFERVVQLEFVRHRYKHACLKCNVTHTEWFKPDSDDIYQHVKVWCQFSQGLQSPEKRSQVSIPLFFEFPSDPDRWYKWAQGYVQSWDNKMSPSEPNTSGKSFVDQDIVTVDDDAESIPGLSPSSSASGTPDDDYSDPPTPTPIERSRNAKPTSGQRLIIPTASPSVSHEAFWTPVESMSTPKGRVLFPRVPGEYPVSPVNIVPEKTKEGANGLTDIFENLKLF
ncbi:hypothetical protein BDV41DRAFT_549775 [Aspergillus transmontanensis]|uniref:Bacteriophage T5 Orf172 DNA-binding domain-containing protein n=1 Tax=Aspergillus transmontanensis TaxID=1034304 RepID=A0A5N6VK35_9EURO|nr:hypothetical protein BDV41DRAFT_549775 [Aspergillus transmontanensis]